MAESSNNPNPTSITVVQCPRSATDDITTATATSNTFRDTQTGVTSSGPEALLHNYLAASSQSGPVPSTRGSQTESLTQLGSLFDGDHSNPYSFPPTISEEDLIPSPTASGFNTTHLSLPHQNANETPMPLLASTPSIGQVQVKIRTPTNHPQPDVLSARVMRSSTRTHPVRHGDMRIQSNTKTPSKSVIE